MANMLTAIRTGFYSFITGNSTPLRTAITQTENGTDYYKLFSHLALQNLPGTTVEVNRPFIVFDLLPVSTDRDTASKNYECTAQFRVVANSQGACETLVGKLIDQLEDSEQSLSFVGYNLVMINKEPVISLGQIDRLWNVVVPYLITLEQ